MGAQFLERGGPNWIGRNDRRGVRTAGRRTLSQQRPTPGESRLRKIEGAKNERLVLHAFRPQDSPEGERYDLQIQRKRLRCHVFGVEANLPWNFQFIAAIDLRPTGNPGNQSMHAVPGAKRHQIVLIEERWTWSHQTKISTTDADQLRQFVQAGLAQQSSDRGQIKLRLLQQMRRYLRSVEAHRPELGHAKKTIIFSYALGPMQGGAARRQPYRGPAKHKERAG
jgi:hypothetical protein